LLFFVYGANQVSGPLRDIMAPILDVNPSPDGAGNYGSDAITQLETINRSKHFHRNWYQSQNPEMANAGLTPAEHFLKYGGPLGRNPGKFFDTAYYLRTYPEVVESGLNPLVHYELLGKSRGFSYRPNEAHDARFYEGLRGRWSVLGFTQPILDELRALQEPSDVSDQQPIAALEEALLRMQQGGGAAIAQALDVLDSADHTSANRAVQRRIAIAQLICHGIQQDVPSGLAVYERAALQGLVSTDMHLIRANLASNASERLAWLNAVWLHHGSTTCAALPDQWQGHAIDHLRWVDRPSLNADLKPTLSVLMPCHNAQHSIEQAILSITRQSWAELEIIVLDQGSDDDSTPRIARLAAVDPRIKLVTLPKETATAAALNHGLAQARGTFITTVDAATVAHPQRLEQQMAALGASDNCLATMAACVWLTPDLRVGGWDERGRICAPASDTMLLRRDLLQDTFGGWDHVQDGYAFDLETRLRLHGGASAIVQIDTAPLIVKRCHGPDTRHLSPQAQPGALKLYRDLSARHYRRTGQVKHTATGKGTATEPRPFPLPAILHPQGRALDGVLDAVDGKAVQALSPDDHVTCDLLILRYPPALWRDQRYLPKITAREIKVIVNQPPMSDYGPDGVTRYSIEACAANLRRWFGKDATWHPIGPLVRDALVTHHRDDLPHIDLSPQDWHNIIDISDWQATVQPPVPPRAQDGTLRIGRHARDHVHKWPEAAQTLRAAYPEDPDIEVHVLGGAKVATAILGHTPANWVVHDYGSLHPRDFLAGIDVWIYFANSGWVESFGRTIIEAMAAGVPVILPEIYRPLFQDAALYASPETAVAMARQLHADPQARAAQVTLARAYVQQRFSYNAHAARLRALGVAV